MYRKKINDNVIKTKMIESIENVLEEDECIFSEELNEIVRILQNRDLEVDIQYQLIKSEDGKIFQGALVTGRREMQYEYANVDSYDGNGCIELETFEEFLERVHPKVEDEDDEY